MAMLMPRRLSCYHFKCFALARWAEAMVRSRSLSSLSEQHAEAESEKVPVLMNSGR